MNTHTQPYREVVRRSRRGGVKLHDLPVLWQRGDRPTAIVPEIVPPAPPCLDSGARPEADDKMLLDKGYRRIADGSYIRVGRTTARKSYAVVEMWVGNQHYSGIAPTTREAYAEMLRARRQIANFGSIVAAVQYGRDQAAEPRIVQTEEHVFA